jgi:short-subunit dehydrogenase
LRYTLITGACKGIGKALAYECASRGMNTLLISNDADCLQGVCDDIRSRMNVDCHCLVLDLMEEGASEKVYRWALDNGFRVNVLINNVGLGRGGTFCRMDTAEFHQMLTLNNRVAVEMTYHFIPMLTQEAPGHILTVSSLEARLPLPYKAVYTGTKSFIYAFSLAIGQELKTSNVSVTVLCPGPVLTNADGLARMNAHGRRSKLLMMYPEQVARIAVRGMLKGRKIIVPGRLNALFFKLGSWLPTGVKMSLLEKLFRVYRT